MLRYMNKWKGLMLLTVIFSTVSSMAYVFIALLLQHILDIATSGNLKEFYKILLFSLFYFVFLGMFMFLYSLSSKKLICKMMGSIRDNAFSGIINHKIEENGSNLSGGQKQRIAVARAIIQEKPILFLDEGTSAIDRQTAYDIENRLLNLEGLTLITITHNFQETILGQYDQIIYMEGGTIKDIGTFHELIQKKSGFFNFSRPQK